MEPLQLGRDRLQGGVRRLDADAVREPADAEQVVAAPALAAAVGSAHQRPHLGPAPRREVELLRQHAHDGVGHAAEVRRLPDHARVAPESPHPRPVAQDHRLRLARGVFSGEEIAAERGRDAQRAKEAGADAPAGQELGARRRAEQVALSRHHVERGQDAGEPFPVEIVGVRQGRAPGGHPRALQHAHQRPGVAIRKRLEKGRVHEGEDRGAGGRAQGHHQDGGGGEGAVFRELSGREAKVLERLLHHRKAGLLAPGLLGGLDATELEHRLAARLLGGEAGAQVVVHVHLEVAFDLLGQLALAPRAPPGAAQPGQPRPQRPHARSPAGARKRARISVACSHSRVSRATWRRPALVSR